VTIAQENAYFRVATLSVIQPSESHAVHLDT